MCQTTEEDRGGPEEVVSVAENYAPCSSQMKEEFPCLRGCQYQDKDCVAQNRSSSQKYTTRTVNCKVTNFAGVLSLILF